MPHFETTIRRSATAFSVTTLNKDTGKVDVEDLAKHKGLFHHVDKGTACRLVLTNKGRDTMEVLSGILCGIHGIKHNAPPTRKKAPKKYRPLSDATIVGEEEMRAAAPKHKAPPAGYQKAAKVLKGRKGGSMEALCEGEVA